MGSRAKRREQGGPGRPRADQRLPGGPEAGRPGRFLDQAHRGRAEDFFPPSDRERRAEIRSGGSAEPAADRALSAGNTERTPSAAINRECGRQSAARFARSSDDGVALRERFAESPNSPRPGWKTFLPTKASCASPAKATKRVWCRSVAKPAKLSPAISPRNGRSWSKRAPAAKSFCRCAEHDSAPFASGRS